MHRRPLLWSAFVLVFYVVLFDALPRIVAGLGRDPFDLDMHVDHLLAAAEARLEPFGAALDAVVERGKHPRAAALEPD